MQSREKANRLKKYNTAKLKVPEVARKFKIELRNRFSCLADDEANNSDDQAQVQDLENDWKKIKETYQKTAEKVLGFRSRSNKPWISAESWKEIDNRREFKMKMDSTRSERVREKLRNAYSAKNKQVKKQLKKDKNDWAEKVAEEAQKAAEQGHLKTVYDATRKLSTKKGKTIDMIKSKDGVLLTKQDEILKRWKEHFLQVLNRPAPEDTGEFEEDDEIPESEIDVDAPTKAEIHVALKEMKNGTAGGVDSLTIEILKADLETSVDVLYYFLHKVWEQEQIPEDWQRGLIVKLPKKGDLTECNNWRGVTLMVVAAKVLGRIIITRIRDGIDDKLRQEQAGFRKGRSTTEQIFILRNIIEQCIEWNANLYVCFVDFEKAFDSVDCSVLWRIMRSYSIPEKIVKMVKVMYSRSECAVIDGSGVCDWFEIKTGVKQGCCMSGFLFLLVVDWVMRKTTKYGNTGIGWKFNNFLEDLDFADDIALISSSGRHIQTKVSNLGRYAKMTGLRINTAKTMMMSWNNPAGRKVQVDGEELEVVLKFVYLGGTVTQGGGADEDIKSRLGKARAAFSKLRNIWKSTQLKLKTKLKIFKSNVVAVLLYGCETWRMTKRDTTKLDVFLHKSLRRIMKIYWPMKISNEEIRNRANISTISEQIFRRRWKFIGHILRIDPSKHPKTALTWAPEGRRSRGRPKETWRRTAEKERTALGFSSWSEATVASRDRAAWRKRVSGPIPT